MQAIEAEIYIFQPTKKEGGKKEEKVVLQKTKREGFLFHALGPVFFKKQNIFLNSLNHRFDYE